MYPGPPIAHAFDEAPGQIRVMPPLGYPPLLLSPDSPEPENLRMLRERFDDVENLITLHGTFQLDKGSAKALLQTAMARPELQGRQLHHVVAHNSVRWWATETIGGAIDETTKRGPVMFDEKAVPLMQMGPTFFAYHASRLPALHHSAARRLLPLLQQADGASYIFVNGGSGRNRSPMDQVNTHAIWGLAEALRQELRESPVRVEELRVTLEHNRLQKERELDPRSSPLSHDIGDICAGIAANAKGWGQHPDHHPMANNSDILMLKAQYPTEPIYDID